MNNEGAVMSPRGDRRYVFPVQSSPSAMSKHFAVIYTTETRKMNDRDDFFGWRPTEGDTRDPLVFRDRYSARIARINLPLEFRKAILT